MQSTLRRILAIFLATLPLSAVAVWGAQSTAPRQQLKADSSWKFFLGDPADAEALSFQ